MDFDDPNKLKLFELLFEVLLLAFDELKIPELLDEELLLLLKDFENDLLLLPNERAPFASTPINETETNAKISSIANILFFTHYPSHF